MASSISHWFGRTELPRPSYTPEASTNSVCHIQSQIDSWVGNMIATTDRQTERHWSNLTSVQLDSYKCTIAQRKQAHCMQTTGKLLVNSFSEVAELCNARGFQYLGRILLKERVLFRRATLVHLAMIEGLERTTNSWLIRCFESASALLDAVRSYSNRRSCLEKNKKNFQRLSELRLQQNEYRIWKTKWNDDHIISQEDLGTISSLKWLNSNLIDAYVSNLNVKFSEPVNNRYVAFLDTNFALQYVFPGTKEHDTLKNTNGAIRSKPLKVSMNCA